MKKFIACFMVIAIVLSSFSVFAVGEKAGDIYATDIAAYVKGAPITSYNIGGKTVIDAEILNWHYGFDVYWYEEERLLDITDKGYDFVSLQAAAGDTVEKIGGKPGDIAGHYYATDIVTKVNGKEIESYNIGGRTVIVAEDMAKCGYDVSWDDKKRELKISFTSDTYAEETDIGKVSSTEDGTLKKYQQSFFSMASERNGSFLIEGKELDIPNGKIYRNGWQNTAFVPLVKTLSSIGAEYEWNNEEKILNVSYDENAALPLTDTKNSEWNAVLQNDVYTSSFPITFVVNGKEYSNKTGLHQFRFNETRTTVDAEIIDGTVYVTSNVFADFMGYSTDDGINFYKKVPASFADELNAKMPTDKNYMFSPLSIKLALGLLLNGADGKTKDEIIEALKISGVESFNESSKKLMQTFENDRTFTFDIANAIFLNTDRAEGEFKTDYTNTLKDFYNAEPMSVNDNNAVSSINNWVNEKTHGKIPTLANTNEFSACLANAIYFKAGWQDEFPKEKTAKDTFTDANGRLSEIEFMNNTKNFKYYCENDISAAVLPYKTSIYDDDTQTETRSNSRLCMVVMKGGKMPYNAAEFAKKALEKGEYKKLNLKMPKFELKFETSLNKILQDMGVKTAFTRDADLSKMLGGDIFVTDTIHKTYIKVDEKGTEAAAATGIMVGATSFMPEENPIDFFLNEPFSYVIMDEASKEILFVGKYSYAE